MAKKTSCYEMFHHEGHEEHEVYIVYVLTIFGFFVVIFLLVQACPG